MTEFGAVSVPVGTSVDKSEQKPMPNALIATVGSFWRVPNRGVAGGPGPSVPLGTSDQSEASRNLKVYLHWLV
jgi:hypothetical protein